MKDKKVKREIRRTVHKEWRDFYNSIFAFPFWVRLRLAWALVKYRKPKAQREQEKLWAQRRKI